VYMGKLVVEDGRLVEIKSPLTETDVLDDSIQMTGQNGDELLLGSGWWSNIKNVFSKAKNIYEKSKPYVSAIKSALPDSQVKSALSSVGYGKLSAGSAGRKYA
jgi:hypothetical protein